MCCPGREQHRQSGNEFLRLLVRSRAGGDGRSRARRNLSGRHVVVTAGLLIWILGLGLCFALRRTPEVLPLAVLVLQAEVTLGDSRIGGILRTGADERGRGRSVVSVTQRDPAAGGGGSRRRIDGAQSETSGEERAGDCGGRQELLRLGDHAFPSRVVRRSLGYRRR